MQLLGDEGRSQFPGAADTAQRVDHGAAVDDYHRARRPDTSISRSSRAARTASTDETSASSLRRWARSNPCPGVRLEQECIAWAAVEEALAAGGV